jgi:hypothetical protein
VKQDWPRRSAGVQRYARARSLGDGRSHRRYGRIAYSDHQVRKVSREFAIQNRLYLAANEDCGFVRAGKVPAKDVGNMLAGIAKKTPKRPCYSSRAGYPDRSARVVH